MALPGSAMDLMSSSMSLSGAASAAVDAKATYDSASAAFDAAVAALSADPNNETLQNLVVMTAAAKGSALTAKNTANSNLATWQTNENNDHTAANSDITTFLGS